MRLLKSINFFLVVITCQYGINFISKCPQLTPREAPTSVDDIRPDDIKVVMAIGDSVMVFNHSLLRVLVLM